MAVIQWTIETQQSIFKGMLTATKMLNPGHGDSGRRGPSGTKRYDSRLAMGIRETERYPDESFGLEREPTTRVVPSELAASSTGGLRGLLIHECLRHLGRRQRHFGELLIHASQLEEEVRSFRCPFPPLRRAYTLYASQVTPANNADLCTRRTSRTATRSRAPKTARNAPSTHSPS